jgi:N-methylhydantoinase A
MGEGFAFAGPAIVEQADTTTLVEPGWTGTVDAAGNLLLTWQAG